MRVRITHYAGTIMAPVGYRADLESVDIDVPQMAQTDGSLAPEINKAILKMVGPGRPYFRQLGSSYSGHVDIDYGDYSKFIAVDLVQE